MAKLLSRNARPSLTEVDEDPRSPLMRRADKWMFVAIVLAGSWVLGPIGFPVLLYALILMNRARKRGELYRPWGITIIVTLTLIDASVNYFAWGLDLLPSHDTPLVQTVWSGYGKLFDGAYYIDYNSASIGGLANISEKTLEVLAIGLLFPLRIVAATALLRMKRWGLQALIISSWMYVGFWIAYVVNLYVVFNARMGASVYGVTGWWAFVLPYAGAFVMLPYLYTVDRELFTE